MVEKCEIYQNKGSQGSLGLTKNLAGGQDLPNFEDLPQGCQGGGGS